MAPPLIVFLLLPGIHAGCSKLTALGRSFTQWNWLLLLIVLSGLTFRLRDVQDINAAPVDGWAFLRIALECFVALLLSFQLVSGRVSWLRFAFRGPTALLSAFALLSAASAFWSVRPDWTVYKSWEYGVDIAFVAALVAALPSARKYKCLFNWMWTLIGLAVLAAWVGAIIAPNEAFSYGQQGSFPIPELSGVWPLQAANSVGDLGALLSIVALGRLFLTARAKSSQRVYWVLLAVGLVTMFVAQCRTSIAGFLFGTLLLFILTGRTVAGILVGGASALAAMFAGLGAAVWTYLTRSQQQQQLLSLSGRLDWWTTAWAKILERPLIGWGGFAGGRFLILTGDSAAADIHSSFVETLLDTGIPGLLLLLLALAGTWWILWRGARSRLLAVDARSQSIECLAVLGLLSVRSLFSSTLIAHSYVTITFILVLGYAEYVRRELRRTVQRTISPSTP
jgi:O-antigen ligase